MTHEFGNIDSWTRDKLSRVADYLEAYLRVMKKQNFVLEYIDAFAGSGFVTRKFEPAKQTLFDADEMVVLKDFIDGSARVALNASPPFSRYTFIEKHEKRCHDLERLKIDFPNLAPNIHVICGDANSHVQQLCAVNWIGQKRRGVMFLDPYGTQVSWDTIKAIADTKAIDLWILFPIGTVNRLLNRNGQIIEARKRRLDTMFGDDRWFETFYKETESHSLFSDRPATIYSKNADTFIAITNYFLGRLKTVFADVAPNPLVMRNSANSPIFLLCFAAGNPNGAAIAVRIAQHILDKK
jgi:three-Cys-motif partner protein